MDKKKKKTIDKPCDSLMLLYFIFDSFFYDFSVFKRHWMANPLRFYCTKIRQKFCAKNLIIILYKEKKIAAQKFINRMKQFQNVPKKKNI